MQNDSLLLNVCYDSGFEYPNVFDEAFRQQWIQKNNADAVIYGSYSGGAETDFVNVNLSIKPEFGTITRKSDLQVTTLPDFSKGGLQGEIDYVVTLFSTLIAAQVGFNCGTGPVEIFIPNDSTIGVVDCETLKMKSKKYLKKITENERFRQYFDANTYLYLGQICMIQDDKKKAAQYFTKAYEMDSTNARVVLFYAEHRIHLLDLDHLTPKEKAAKLIPTTTKLMERAFWLSPNDESIIFALGAWHFLVTKDLKRAQAVVYSNGYPIDMIYHDLILGMRENIDLEILSKEANSPN